MVYLGFQEGYTLGNPAGAVIRLDHLIAVGHVHRLRVVTPQPRTGGAREEDFVGEAADAQRRKLRRMRRELVRLLRATHLIQVADRFASWRAARREARANAQYQASHPRQHFPDPALVFEVTARADYQTYQETGRAHAQLIADMLRETSVPNTPRILDWGCGPGRVLSHLSAALNAPGAQFEGCDPNSQAVRAARRAAPEAKIERLASKPPSP